MARTRRTVRLVGDEPAQVQSALHDVQFSVRQYYRHTTGWPDHRLLTTPARSTVAFIQKVHDVLSHPPMDGGIKNYAHYAEIFDRLLNSGHDGAATVRAFTYLRHVGQHLVFSVQPDPGAVLGGMTGQRSYNKWAPVPIRAHNRLRSGTKKLRPLYRSHLEGRSVTDTFLTALKFFADVCPRSINRAGLHGEWTWFPLRAQPGVLWDRLHPEEPDGEAARLRWLKRRLPGGEFRVVLGVVTMGGVQQVVGATFSKNHSYSGFVEHPSQVERDINGGYDYYLPAAGALRELEFVKYPEFGGGSRGGLRSRVRLVDVLDEPLSELPGVVDDWSIIDQDRLVETFVSAEESIHDLATEPFQTYRARRLYAEYPIQ